MNALDRDLATGDRHTHEAEVYDAMAERMLTAMTDAELRIRPDAIPFANREHVDYLTFAIGRLGPLQGKRILEVGVGSGSLAAYLALQGADVTGIDVSAGILRVAARRAELSGVASSLHLTHSPVEEFAAAEGFDAIIGNNVLHHFDLPVALPNLRSLLRAGAPAVFCEPVLFVPEVLRSIRYSKLVSHRFPPHVHTPDERSLDKKTIALLEREFDCVEWMPFHVTCRLQHFVELSDRTWNLLERFDRALLRTVPAAKHVCRQIVLTMSTTNSITATGLGSTSRPTSTDGEPT